MVKVKTITENFYVCLHIVHIFVGMRTTRTRTIYCEKICRFILKMFVIKTIQNYCGLSHLFFPSVFEIASRQSFQFSFIIWFLFFDWQPSLLFFIMTISRNVAFHWITVVTETKDLILTVNTLNVPYLTRWNPD